MAGIIEGGVVPSDKVADDGDYDKHELDCAVDTLMRAEEIKGDLKMMKALRPLLEKKSKAIRSLDDLRKLASDKRLEEIDSEMEAQKAEMGYGNSDGSDGDYMKKRRG